MRKASQRSSGAHPRTGGENMQAAMQLTRDNGSSPHGRGKRGGQRHGRVLHGLIPARAGKTRLKRGSLKRPGAHPRTGGENAVMHGYSIYTRGSSPHGRGKLVTDPRLELGDGLIPARAGKTWRRRAWRRPAPAHPRTGGENRVREPRFDLDTGSSPHGRGKRLELDLRAILERLIPARAGKTNRGRQGSLLAGAHPRTGGENAAASCAFCNSDGSSPHGRGKHFLTCAFIERIGQILETLELAVSSGSYSLCDVYATDAPRDPARSIGLVPLSNRDASSESVLRSRRASRDLPTSGKRGPARCAHDRPSRHVLSSCSP